MIDIILIALLVFGVLLAVLSIIRKRKFGSCCSGSCGGGCGSCSFESSCTDDKKECSSNECDRKNH